MTQKLPRFILAALSILLGASLLLAQGPLTPGANLQVRTDANGYLLTSAAAYTGPDGPLRPFSNLGVRTDANGYLLTTTSTTGTALFFASDGTVCTIPAYSWASDTDTGWVRTSAGTIRLCADGADKLQLESGGVRMSSDTTLSWGNSTTIAASSYDLNLERVASGVLRLTDNTPVGVAFRTTTDNLVEIRTRTNSANAALTASALTASTFVNLGSRTTITVDAATTFAASASYLVLACTGAETINTITGAVTGTILYLENTDTDCTIADDDDATAANAVDLTGTATNDVGAVAKVITLIYNGASWFQTAESDN